MFPELMRSAAVYANFAIWLEITFGSIYQYAGNDFGPIVASMIRRRVALIVAGGTPPAVAAKNLSSTIPIVVAVSGNIVGAGLARSLAHPAGNVTGLTSVAPDLGGKRLEIIKDILTKVLHVAVFSRAKNASHSTQRTLMTMTKFRQGIAAELFATLL